MIFRTPPVFQHALIERLDRAIERIDRTLAHVEMTQARMKTLFTRVFRSQEKDQDA